MGDDYRISRPLDNSALRVVSFGAGVQSTVMLLMACKHEIGPMPDVAIFADTQWEPMAVYDHLEWVKSEVARLTNGAVKISIVSAGNIKADHLAGRNTTGQRFASMPLFTKTGMTRRQCTKEYKVEPITKEIRKLLGVRKGGHVPKNVFVEQWIGISTDEIQRLKDGRHRWLHHRWPLIEKNMSRGDCYEWFNKNYPGLKLAKSACIGCPFSNNQQWQNLKSNSPDEWEDACKFDEAIRGNSSDGKLKEDVYLHKSATPLRGAFLGDVDTLDMFAEECEGMCGF